MDRHPLDRSLASDLSNLVLQKRRERGELMPCPLDSSNQMLYPLPSQLVQREAFISSRPTGVSEAEWIVERQRRRLQG